MEGTDNLTRTTHRESGTVPVLQTFPLLLGKFKIEKFIVVLGIHQGCAYGKTYLV